jgi:hypothetical protein
MGRPLKIAKAQAVLTVTNTTATTNIVTVSQTLSTLGIIAGMPFVPSITTGTNLIAATTYWILSITGASTFTVSATPLNANPTSTPVTLTTGTTASALSVGVVDAYFNNPNGPQWPATNANTYSVVGGNTAIFGKQVLANVAIGVNGVGTLYGDTGNLNVYGSGTDFANTLSVGSSIQVASANINGGTDYTNIGFVGTNTGYITVAVANTNATGNVIRTSGNAQTLFVGAPVIFDANTGGLVTGTTYFVDAIANASAFTVATSQYGPQQAVTTGTTAANARIDVTVLAVEPTSNFAGASFVYATPEAGFIVRQKGKTKYLVTGTTSGLTAAVYTANVANTALTPNTMSIRATNAASGVQFVSSVNDHSSELFPATVAPGSLVTGTVYTIYSAGTTNWTSVGASANMTGITFAATGTASGTGLAVLANVNPDVISSFNAAAVANAANGQPNPIVTINNA